MSPEFAPMLRWSKCCILGPRAPSRWGGNPRASSKAWSLPTSLSSLSLSTAAVVSPDGPPVVPVAALLEPVKETCQRLPIHSWTWRDEDELASVLQHLIPGNPLVVSSPRGSPFWDPLAASWWPWPEDIPSAVVDEALEGRGCFPDRAVRRLHNSSSLAWPWHQILIAQTSQNDYLVLAQDPVLAWLLVLRLNTGPLLPLLLLPSVPTAALPAASSFPFTPLAWEVPMGKPIGNVIYKKYLQVGRNSKAISFQNLLIRKSE